MIRVASTALTMRIARYFFRTRRSWSRDDEICARGACASNDRLVIGITAQAPAKRARLYEVYERLISGDKGFDAPARGLNSFGELVAGEYISELIDQRAARIEE